MTEMEDDSGTCARAGNSGKHAEGESKGGRVSSFTF